MLTILLAVLAQVPAPDGEPEALTGAATRATTIAVIGASVSSGFGNASELEVRSDVPLGIFLESALVPLEESEVRIEDFGDSRFFVSPMRNGKAQVTDALTAEPDVVVALDFLFWYAFGRPGRGDPRREEGFEEGLAQLERFDVPIVVGDLPDIDHALDGRGLFGKPLVSRRIFPSDEERERMNARLAEWAVGRENVEIAPLAMVVDRMRSAGTVELQGARWSMDSLRDALQKDLLHPTAHGTIWMAMFAADALVRTGALERDDVTFDPKSIRTRLFELTSEAREERRKREAARAARRKRIEERRERRDDKFAA